MHKSFVEAARPLCDSDETFFRVQAAHKALEHARNNPDGDKTTRNLIDTAFWYGVQFQRTLRRLSGRDDSGTNRRASSGKDRALCWEYTRVQNAHVTDREKFQAELNVINTDTTAMRFFASFLRAAEDYAAKHMEPRRQPLISRAVETLRMRFPF